MCRRLLVLLLAIFVFVLEPNLLEGDQNIGQTTKLAVSISELMEKSDTDLRDQTEAELAHHRAEVARQQAELARQRTALRAQRAELAKQIEEIRAEEDRLEQLRQRIQRQINWRRNINKQRRG